MNGQEMKEEATTGIFLPYGMSVEANPVPVCRCKGLSRNIEICQLHAAAPKLLRALEKLLDWESGCLLYVLNYDESQHICSECGAISASNTEPPHETDCAVGQARAAIREAKPEYQIAEEATERIAEFGKYHYEDRPDARNYEDFLDHALFRTYDLQPTRPQRPWWKRLLLRKG